MGISDMYNKIGKGVGEGISNTVAPLKSFLSSTTNYTAPPIQKEPVYNIPPVIPPQHRNVFIQQAKLAGVTPDEFGQIAAREQGATTTPNRAKLIGQVDSTDRGVMQVNKLNEPMIQGRFKTEFGRQYNPNSAIDSIIGARMVLEENKRQFDQMKANKTYVGPYTNQDLIDSYNLGVNGIVKAKSGNSDKQNRLTRYQKAGK